jgi:hypothetical protein
MNPSQITARFFALTDADTKSSILTCVANQYGISHAEAEAEVMDSEAESLLDYLTGPVRAATSVLMKRHGLA